MNVIYVGVGEYAISGRPGEIVKTLALGSCVAVVILDANNKSVGLLHIALPESSINKKRAKEKPGMFADTGIPSLLEEMQKLGYDGKSELIIKLAGGASIMDPNKTFNIGKRNVLAIRNTLSRFGLDTNAEDVGGNISRSVSIDLNMGKVMVSSPGRGEWEL